MILEKNRSNFIAQLEILTAHIPNPIYWKDIDGKFLGANAATVSYFGYSSLSEILGKTNYEIWPAEIASRFTEDDDYIISTGKAISKEDTCIDTCGNIKYCQVIKAPLHNEYNKIMGIIYNAIDITSSKEKAQLEKSIQEMENYRNVFLQLEKNLAFIPSAFYWKDVNHRFLGANETALQYVGFKSVAEVLGKTDYDIWSAEFAERFIEDDKYVIRTGKVVSKEDVYTDIFGNIKYCQVIKAPLYNENNKIIGIIGNSIDITAQKELENEKHKIEAEQQAKFKNDVDQVVHDIRSPLTSLDMLATFCTELPEIDRIAFRHVATSIADIANNLLSKYTSKPDGNSSSIGYEDERQPVLISTALSQLLSDKKYQYKQSPVRFELRIDPQEYFTFINIQPTSLKRALSNIINNAVDAFNNKDGKVVLQLVATPKTVKIVINDNGRGMPASIIEKILHGEAVTAGKADGHGIGMTQVRETISRNEGKLSIDSAVNVGTTISIEFAKTIAPEWIATQVNLTSEDILVILDDDESIHFAWDSRFEPIKGHNPNIQIHHFRLGADALNFIHSVPKMDRYRLFLLSDYELLQQDVNGLEIIKQSNVARSILVTSHYNSIKVRDAATTVGTKILPKQLATVVLIRINGVKSSDVNPQDIEPLQTNDLKTVDLVLLDDDEMIISTLTRYMFNDMAVDTYTNPEDFLINITKYNRNTVIALDNNYKNSQIKGIELVKELHKRGFTNLYILSGEASLTDTNCGGHATIILKSNLDDIKKHLVKDLINK